MIGLSDFGNGQWLCKAIFYVDQPLVDLFSKKIFNGPGHGRRGFSSPHNRDSIVFHQIKFDHCLVFHT
ncbi:hypothetical protein ES703_125529 [subsurface metagenome]